MEFLYALIPVFAWGTWLAPAQNVRFPNQQVKTLYVTLANLLLASLVLLGQAPGSLAAISPASFWLIFAGGVIWALSSLCAFVATDRLGIARAFGIWAPLNIVTSMLWGALLFDEFPNTAGSALLLLGAALVIIIVGVLLIIFSQNAARVEPTQRRRAALGYAGAIGAGLLWGTYFIPIQYADVSMWTGSFPLALGMLGGSALLTLLAGRAPRLDRRSDFLRASLSGLIWGVGNFGMLLLVGALGAGRGFTIAQLSVVVNGLVGIFILKEPQPGSRAANLTLLGCVLATAGGILLGALRQ
ncbi:MAG: GRP family sugar transporter [Anaerolineae bacterium]|jgi:glucose uptake protein